MSRILKKSLAVVLALAICLSTVISGISVFGAGAVYTGSYKITFGSASNDRITATVAVTSTATDISAVLTTLSLPGLPITAISTDSVYDLTTDCDTFPASGLTALRVLIDAKTTGSCYNYANIYVTFDVSSKALVEMGVDPNASTAISVSIDSIEVSSYNGGPDGLESEVWIKVADGGSSVATASVKGSCSHTYVPEVVEEATCNKSGLKRYTCSSCGYSYDEVLATIAHTWDAGVDTTPASCTAGGIKTYTCTVCSATQTETTASLGGHAYYSGEYDADPAHFQISAGSCLEAGTAQPLCTRCQTASSTTIDIGYGAHAISEYTITSEPNCGAAGVKTGFCDLCFAEATVSYGEPTGNHTWGDGVETTPPTTTSVGVMTYTCSVCQATKTEDIPMLEEDCKHINYTSAYAANNGVYNVVVTCSDCSEVISTIVTDIPATATHKTTMDPDRSVVVSDTFGVRYMFKNSQVSGCTDVQLKLYRTTCNSSYNFDTAKDVVSTFTKYGSTRQYVIYSGVALYETNLPVTAILTATDANGNTVISNPLVDYPVDLVWGLYQAAGDDAAKKKCFVDLVNLGSEAQLVFGKDTNELGAVILPRDKFAFLQSDGTQEDPTFDLDTMPNSIVNNPSAPVSTTTYNLVVNAAISTSPCLNYTVMKGKNLDRSKLRLEVSYESNYNDTPISKTVIGTEATETTDGWLTYSTRSYYYFSATKLYDSDRPITATVYYNDQEMYTSTYSVETYVAQNVDNATLGPVVKAIAKFGASARALFGYYHSDNAAA